LLQRNFSVSIPSTGFLIFPQGWPLAMLIGSSRAILAGGGAQAPSVGIEWLMTTLYLCVFSWANLLN
jgi:hypothetical protein